jgi:peptide/nickel transport system permease protein
MDTLSGETLNVFFPGLNSSQPDPGREIFRRPGNYAFGLEMAFQDQTPGAVNVSIHFDDVNLRLLGKNYGLLGTDQFGVDLFSQLIYGARVSLLVGLLSAVISVVVGLLVGLVAGYIGGITDEVLMRFTDMLLVLPFLPLLIVMIAILGASIWNVILVISLLGWMGFARVVRSQVLSLKERPFVEAARAAGAGAGRIIRTHVVPNVMSLTYVTLALSVPAAIVAEAALSFLGLSDVTVTSWGHTIYNAENFNGFRNLWWVIPPGLAIATVSLSFILLGYALDEVLNPKLRLRR